MYFFRILPIPILLTPSNTTSTLSKAVQHPQKGDHFLLFEIVEQGRRRLTNTGASGRAAADPPDPVA